MNNMKTTTLLVIGLALVFLSSGCKQNGNESDAYGNFEASEYVISAENSGKILKLNIKKVIFLQKPNK